MIDLRWIARHAALIAWQERPSAKISGVRLVAGNGRQDFEVRDSVYFPETSAPLLRVDIPSIDVTCSVEDWTYILRQAVWMSMGDVPDRGRICPCCRKPYVAVA